jgi:hypothetical protein
LERLERQRGKGNRAMQVRNATEEQVYTAAEEVGVRICNLRCGGSRRPYLTFILRTGEPSVYRRDWRGKTQLAPAYQRKSQRARISTAKETHGKVFCPTVPGAVCWHGHAAFYRALYKLAPNAWVRTAKAVYTSAEQFEATYRDSANKPGGAFSGPYSPLPYQQACGCTESAS